MDTNHKYYKPKRVKSFPKLQIRIILSKLMFFFKFLIINYNNKRINVNNFNSKSCIMFAMKQSKLHVCLFAFKIYIKMQLFTFLAISFNNGLNLRRLHNNLFM